MFKPLLFRPYKLFRPSFRRNLQLNTSPIPQQQIFNNITPKKHLESNTNEQVDIDNKESNPNDVVQLNKELRDEINNDTIINTIEKDLLFQDNQIIESGNTEFQNISHYVDTLKMYKQLSSAGFSRIQSEKIIALIEKNIFTNFSRIFNDLSFKKDLENENYLFQSAESELSVEIKRTREMHFNELRSNINLLDYELNNVTDELNELMIQCANDCEVLTNDYNSDNKLSEKQLIIKIKELDNRINSELITELKFGIESLRWSLTRRGLLSILAVAVSVLITVTVSKLFNDNVLKEEEEEKLTKKPVFVEKNGQIVSEFESDNSD